MNILNFASFYWSNLFRENYINIALNLFYEIMLDIIRKNVPRKSNDIYKFSIRRYGSCLNYYVGCRYVNKRKTEGT